MSANVAVPELSATVILSIDVIVAVAPARGLLSSFFFTESFRICWAWVVDVHSNAMHRNNIFFIWCKEIMVNKSGVLPGLLSYCGVAERGWDSRLTLQKNNNRCKLAKHCQQPVRLLLQLWQGRSRGWLNKWRKANSCCSPSFPPALTFALSFGRLRNCL